MQFDTAPMLTVDARRIDVPACDLPAIRQRAARGDRRWRAMAVVAALLCSTSLIFALASGHPNARAAQPVVATTPAPVFT